MSFNKLTTVGRLTADPALSQVGDAPCVSFTLASDTRVRDANGGYLTNFYRCAAWRRQAEICAQYLHKGDKVTLAGDLSLRPYLDKNGVERMAVQLNISDIELPPRPQPAQSAPAEEDDGLPI